MNLNEIVLKKENELTDKQQSFLKVHNSILSAGVLISNGLIELSSNLKKMRDEKLYLEAGYNSFEDYAELACGLKRSQAYKYILIVEKLGTEFVHSSGQIGITKLSLLASLPEEEKEEVIEKVNIEDSSVSELKKEIAKLKAEKKDSEKLLADKQSLETEIEKLNDKISELENVQPETVTVEVEKDSSEKDKKIEEYKQKLADLKEKLLKKTEEADTLQFTNESLSKQLEISNSSELVEFKIKFGNLQALIQEINNIIPKLPEDKQAGCKQALKKVVEQLC